MATATNEQIEQSRPIHVFDQLEFGQLIPCQVCKQEPAAYHWTEQRAGRILQKRDLVICRICAGMILLIGKDE